jgi:ketosteroid isomerase-like protein
MGENTELVRAALEAFARGEFDQALEFAHPGDRLRACGQGERRASRRPVWLVYTVAGGRITRQDAYLTREQALASPLP